MHVLMDAPPPHAHYACILHNGRQPQLFQKWKTTTFFSKIEGFAPIFSQSKLILGLARLSKICFIYCYVILYVAAYTFNKYR